MRILLPLLLFLCLACGGALDAMTPEVPFDLPAETHSTGFNYNTVNGATTVEVTYNTASVDEVDLQGDLHQALSEDGWTVKSSVSNAGPGVLDCTREGETMTVTIEGDGAGGANFAVVWNH